METRCRSSLGNVSVIRFSSTVEEKRSKKKLNCAEGNLKWRHQQQGITPMMYRLLIQITSHKRRNVSSTAAFRISQGIISIWRALVTCKLSDIPSPLLYFSVVLYTVKGRQLKFKVLFFIMSGHLRVYAHFALGPFLLHNISSEGCCNRNIRETNRALENFSEKVKTNLALNS